MRAMSSSHASAVVGGGLLCELHAHSRWSDGDLALADVVDLYGRAGFDVLCMTDHVVRGAGMITAANHARYLADVRREAIRAERQYGMIVLPGLEQHPVRPEAIRVVEQLLSDVCPRMDDLRRAVFLVESS